MSYVFPHGRSAESEMMIRKGEYLTCSAGHRCAVFTSDVVAGAPPCIQDVEAVQENYRLRSHRAIPPCFECGRIVDIIDIDGTSYLHVEDRWAPPLPPKILDELNKIEGNP